jgi:uncharacterized damage-inducible protein DinB
MSERTEALATQFERANDALISRIESLTDAQWKAICADEGWTVGVTAHHVAQGHGVITGMAQAIAAGQTLPPMTWEMLNEGNAKHAQEFAGVSKTETLALLRQSGPAAAAAVRSMSDDQLQRSASLMGNPMTAEQIVQGILIGHVTQHSASIQQAS